MFGDGFRNYVPMFDPHNPLTSFGRKKPFVKDNYWEDIPVENTEIDFLASMWLELMPKEELFPERTQSGEKRSKEPSWQHGDVRNTASRLGF
jgi:hypothetical protein